MCPRTWRDFISVSPVTRIFEKKMAYGNDQKKIQHNAEWTRLKPSSFGRLRYIRSLRHLRVQPNLCIRNA